MALLSKDRRGRTIRRLFISLAVTAGFLSVTASALAHWTVSGTSTTMVRAIAFQVTGTRPLVHVTGQDILISWKQSRFMGRRLGSHDIGGYVVDRHDVSGHSQEVRTACARKASNHAVVHCVERDVPEGTWEYTVTPVLGSWTGTQGSESTVTVLAMGDVRITSPVDGHATKTSWPVIAGLARAKAREVVVAISKGRNVSDVVWKHSVPVIDGSWSVRPADALPEGLYLVRAGHESHDGHTAWSAPSSFRIDATAPSTTDDSLQLGDHWRSTQETVMLTSADPDGSGVAATYFTIDGSVPTRKARRGNSVILDAEGIHHVRYFSIDHVGNAEAIKTAARFIRVDRTAPQAVGVRPLPRVISDGHVLTAFGEDLLSGVADVQFEYCPATGCDVWALVNSDLSGPAFSIAWRQQPADGTYWVRARMVDRAGNATISAAQEVDIHNPRPQTTQ